jgi:hypothetical protein
MASPRRNFIYTENREESRPIRTKNDSYFHIPTPDITGRGEKAPVGNRGTFDPAEEKIFVMFVPVQGRPDSRFCISGLRERDVDGLYFLTYSIF